MFDPHGEAIDDLRAVLARNGRAVGLELSADRREDRAEIRRAVLEGEADLRASVKIGDIRKGRGHPSIRCPSWYGAHGVGFEQRRLEREARRLRARELANVDGRSLRPDRERAYISLLPAPVTQPLPPNFPPGLRPLWDWASRRYTDAAAALVRFEDMAAETPDTKALAIWYLRHRPEAFGDVTSAEPEGELGPLLRKVSLRRALGIPPSAKSTAAALALAEKVKAMKATQKLLVQKAAMAGSLRRVARRIDDEMGDGTPRALKIHDVAASVRRFELRPSATDRGPGQKGLLGRIATAIKQSRGQDRSGR